MQVMGLTISNADKRGGLNYRWLPIEVLPSGPITDKWRMAGISVNNHFSMQIRLQNAFSSNKLSNLSFSHVTNGNTIGLLNIYLFGKWKWDKEPVQKIKVLLLSAFQVDTMNLIIIVSQKRCSINFVCVAFLCSWCFVKILILINKTIRVKAGIFIIYCVTIYN